VGQGAGEEMKETPVLMKGEMVRAILDGRKTQTRRVIKPQPEDVGAVNMIKLPDQLGDQVHYYFQSNSGKIGLFKPPFIKCPFGHKGDLLLVAARPDWLPKTYCVGSDGEIYSKARGTWQPLKKWTSKKRYSAVTIVLEKIKKTYHVHKLVCEAFHGKQPKKSSQVRHLDGNPENSMPWNLKWGTQEENWMDRKAHGNGCEGEKHHDSKFSNIEREHIKWAVGNDLCSQKRVSRILGVSQYSIYGICHSTSLIVPEQEKPSLPIWSGGLWLELTADPEPQRLQEITRWDIDSEGCPYRCESDDGIPKKQIVWFVDVWESINGPGSWASNSWVWKLEFKRVHK